MFRKQHPPPGSRPGTLAIPPDSPPPRIHVYQYTAEELLERPIGKVEELVPFARSDKTTWVDVRGLGDEAVLRRIAELFNIDGLSLEDAVNLPQRAKSEARDQHQVIIARLPILTEDGGVDTPQVCLLLGKRHLVSFQETALGAFEPVRERLRSGIGPIRALGPDYLAYALIDTLIDRYYPPAEQLSHELEDLEDEISERDNPEAIARLHDIRRQLVILRRVGWPQREAITSLIRDQTPFVTDEVRAYLRDTQDHIAQIVELIDSCREMTVSLMDIHLSALSQRTNEVMKVLTIVASIFIPLTFIAGIYGMNFEYMPELHRQHAYPMVIATMAVVAALMLGYFWHRGWIGGRKREDRK
ncbi:MAG: magnesium/cobalt transporter CorA [Gemmatimonadales bacterium]